MAAGGFIEFLKDVARTPGVLWIDVSGVYLDENLMREVPFSRRFRPADVIAGNVPLPPNLNERIAVVGNLPRGVHAGVLDVPDRVNEIRDKAGLAPLPWEAVCDSAVLSGGAVRYRLR